MKRLLSLLLVLALMLSLGACGEEPVETSPSTQPTTQPNETTEPPLDGAAIYNEARAAVDAATGLELELFLVTTMELGAETLTQSSAQELKMAGIGTEEYAVSRLDKLTQGNGTVTFNDYYTAGRLYTLGTGGAKFQGETTREYFDSTMAPAVLLDATLYGNIEVTEEAGSMELTFSEATGPETWALPEGARYLTSSGTATIDKEGVLTETTYAVTYTLGGCQMERTYEAQAVVDNEVTVVAPSDADSYTELTSVEAIRALEVAVLSLQAADVVSSYTMQTILSQAGGVGLQVSYDMKMDNSGESLACQFDQTSTLITEEGTDTLEVKETVIDGTYTYTYGEEEPEITENFPPVRMIEYLQGYLVENITPLTGISQATVEELAGLWYITFEFDEERALSIEDNISERFYGDPDLLDEAATKYSTTVCQGFISIDPLTGLPTATGTTFLGTHTIDRQAYDMALEVTQSFTIDDRGIYEDITDRMLPEEEPEEKASPLFYHVTGPEGQEMWLLGTIHVGDNRTAYLPQEIYDAFEASDALAVECNTRAFDEQLLEDEALMEQVAEAYYYTDGTTVASVLEEETYQLALQLMKISGNYNSNAEYMKISLWESSISNFFLNQWHTLSSAYGVDNRLMRLAEGSGKEIREIESNQSQIQMLTGFSQKLQVWMLEDTLLSSAESYGQAVDELYELWCAGDEAALREYLSSDFDMDALTEEEKTTYLPLLEEYNKAMSFDRNEGMLEVAKEYLESGDVVFYAVGLAHLLDDTNGLVDVLRDAGYTVELVDYQ